MSRRVFALKYMTRFRCIADRCEDTCCAGMQIPITADDDARLRGVLGPPEADEKLQPLMVPMRGYSTLLARTPEGACGFLDPSRFCSVIGRFGDDAIPDVCALYPRVFAHTPMGVEVVASLSCPEAARLCLLTEDGTDFVEAELEGLARVKPATPSGQREPWVALHDLVRDAGVALLRDRRWPVRARLAQFAELGVRTEPFFFRGAQDPARVGEQLAVELERARSVDSRRDADEALRQVEVDGVQIVQMLFSITTGLSSRGTARFQQLLNAVTQTYQAAALEREPSLGQAPERELMWVTLSEVLRAKRAHADTVLGGRLEPLFERYWVNDLYREPYTRAETLGAHTFQMILRAAVLRFLVLGHPVIDALASASPTLEWTEAHERAFDAAFIEAAQLYSKHIERDASLFELVAAQCRAASPGTDALGLTRRFATAA